MKSFTRWRVLVVVALVGSGGCAWWPRALPIDPAATFAAHTDSAGLVIDKMDSGQGGKLVPSTSALFEHGPQLLLETTTGPAVALWIEGPDIIVRPTHDPSAPAIGRVDARWDSGAVQLTFLPEGNGAYRTTAFKRMSGGAAPAALGQPAELTLDMRGVYLADITDAEGAQAGWLRVRIGVNWGPMHLYEGVLPASVNGPLAVAAVARLEREINAVGARSINPHLGN
jgi:hypothetical protein